MSAAAVGHPGLPAAGRTVLLRLLLGAVVLLAWDASGLDLALTRLVGDAQGFAWRDHPVTRGLLHDGGRVLAWGVLAVLLWDAWRRPPAAGPGRPERLAALVGVLACLLVVPLLKRWSLTSCPWDLAEFGGSAAHVSHWLAGVSDGGPGHCFPSGHATAAFAFLAPALLRWRWRPSVGRWWLATVLVVGAVFAADQWVRGAHFLSHSLWSAWLCWAVAEGAVAAGALLARRTAQAGSTPAMPR